MEDKLFTIQDIKDAYNAGYLDREANHINDADNYVNELFYIKIKENEK